MLLYFLNFHFFWGFQLATSTNCSEFRYIFVGWGKLLIKNKSICFKLRLFMDLNTKFLMRITNCAFS
jgi:hypothetical protein